jgi:hypothetical protein
MKEKNLMGNKTGRRLVTCSSCKKDKLNYGLNMCSACLRHHKRKTRPEFYLGTCYSEITRRTGIGDPRRPKYKGLPRCTKDEFISRFLKDTNFLNQYKLWQESGFKRGSAPSIDRIEEEKGYIIENLQFLSNIENGIKSSGLKCVLIKDTIVLDFKSISDAMEWLGLWRKHKIEEGVYNGWLLKYV